MTKLSDYNLVLSQAESLTMDDFKSGPDALFGDVLDNGVIIFRRPGHSTQWSLHPKGKALQSQKPGEPQEPLSRADMDMVVQLMRLGFTQGHWDGAKNARARVKHAWANFMSSMQK